jgi:glutamate dehydrogenase
MAPVALSDAANGSANGHADATLPLRNKLHDHVIRTPGRQPSPQPTHLSVPGSQHKLLHDNSSGYVATTFEGKKQQMEQGKFPVSTYVNLHFN